VRRAPASGADLDDLVWDAAGLSGAVLLVEAPRGGSDQNGEAELAIHHGALGNDGLGYVGEGIGQRPELAGLELDFVVARAIQR